MGRGGKTTARVTSFTGTAVLENGVYRPEFQFNLDVWIWSVESEYKHEWRHAKDMFFAWIFQVINLQKAEKRIFSDSAACEFFIGQKIEETLNNMNDAVNRSIIWRDSLWLGWTDSLEAFGEWISGTGGRNGISLIQEFRE